ncbi:MAG: hypothetical protein CVV02_08895 [Firmicutes bacterium HGW-Firmicutes-7]|nr:MAG: hypothetical protein CVV02_08895 [Firmicutes bacterium HGW-Firmicutes-7]
MSGLMNIIALRLKLIYRSSAIRMLTIVIALLFIALIGSLYADVENSTKIKIGYVDESNTKFSTEVVRNLHKNELLKPIETSLEKGAQLIKKGEIEALFVIKADAEKRVYEGEFDEIIGIYYLSNNHLAPIIGDVFVGEMLKEISIITAVNYLEEVIGDYEEKEEALTTAYEYGQELAKNLKKDYYVNIEIFSFSEDKIIDTKNISNQMIYHQMILGIILSFLSFFVLFTASSIVKDEENHLIQKIIISKTSKVIIILGDYLSIVIASTSIAMLFALISAYYSNDFLKTLYLNSVILLLFIGSFSALILFMTKLFKSVSSFVVMGAVLILIIGIISGCFFNIDLSLPIIKSFAYFTPSYQALNRLMGVVVNGSFINIGGYITYISISIATLLFGSVVLWSNKKVTSS